MILKATGKSIAVSPGETKAQVHKKVNEQVYSNTYLNSPMTLTLTKPGSSANTASKVAISNATNDAFPHQVGVFMMIIVLQGGISPN